MKTRLKILVGLLMVLFPTAGWSNGEIPFWKLVGSSHLIAAGEMTVPVELIRAAEKSGDHKYLPVEVAVHDIHKGSLENSDLTFRFYTDTEQYGGLSREELILLDKKDVILFLQFLERNYYLAIYSPQAVQAVSANLFSEIEREIELQEQLLQESDLYFQTHDLPLESKVTQLVELMVSKQTQPGGSQAIYDTLISLGPEAVPAIIKHMDDRRRLTIPKITLEPMGGFEGLIHYGPEVVTDLMSVALTRITEQDLTQIYNGGTELQRQSAVRIWKVYERRQNKTL